MKSVSVPELRAMIGRPDLALIDVRETAEYNLAHIGGATSLPRRLIEFAFPSLVPWQGTPVVVCDDDGRRAAMAAETLEAMGYREVGVLDGGLNRWVTEDGETEWGVNVPSKDFGEKVLLRQHVPEVTADELHARQQRGERLVILDSRTPEEHQRGCIPGSRSMPGAELGLRAAELIDAPDVTVVVHCAGRTRSIIGAATLRRMGLQNVVALKNGTMGWQLAGLEIERGSRRTDLPQPSDAVVAEARVRALQIAAEAGVVLIDVDGMESLTARADRENVYLMDVRTREEYDGGHIPGFRWAPGGQLVQATDNFIAVKAGTIVLACDSNVRSCLTGAWLREMGFPKVYVIDGGAPAWVATGNQLVTGPTPTEPFGYASARASVPLRSMLELAAAMNTGSAPAIVFVGTSEEFSAGHVAGSSWVSRSWLELEVEGIVPDRRASVIVTCPDGIASTLAADTLLEMGYRRVAVLEGGIRDWKAAGFPLETGLTGVTRLPEDVLPATRSYAQMLNYLRWEEELGRKYVTA